MAEEKELSGPDFAQGISLAEFSDGGMLTGHTNGKPILVARCDDTFFAIGASCTPYGGPLGPKACWWTIPSDAGRHKVKGLGEKRN